MKTKQKLMAYFLSFALLLGMISTVNVSAAKKISLSNKKITITKGNSKTIKVKNTKKKVKWKILSGKKCITLKKKGKTAAIIKGKKKGKAKIQALVEKKKLVCTVTVDDKVISEQQNNSHSVITTNIPEGNAGNPLPTTDINNPTPTSEGNISTDVPNDNTNTPVPNDNTPTPDDNKPTQTPDTTIPTEPPYQGEIITLHYNDENADEVKEQIKEYLHYDYNHNPIIDKYVHVIVDDGVTSIGLYAFQSCSSLYSIEIPSSVTSIGHGAFSYCDSLNSIKVAIDNQTYDSRDNCNAIIEKATNTLIAGCQNTKIPSSVTSIGMEAFKSCSSLYSIEIPSSVTSIGFYAFQSCSSLYSIEIPSSVTSIESDAFSDCSSLESIKVAVDNQTYDSRDNCNAIIEKATNTLITGCQNTKIPSSVTSIGNGAFSGCSGLYSIEIPSSVTSIGDWAFQFCDTLTSIEIPDSVTSIGNWAFSGCFNLSIIEIPDSVTSIGDGAFTGCFNLGIIWQDTIYGSTYEFLDAFRAKYPS